MVYDSVLFCRGKSSLAVKLPLCKLFLIIGQAHGFLKDMLALVAPDGHAEGGIFAIKHGQLAGNVAVGEYTERYNDTFVYQPRFGLGKQFITLGQVYLLGGSFLNHLVVYLLLCANIVGIVYNAVVIVFLSVNITGQVLFLSAHGTVVVAPAETPRIGIGHRIRKVRTPTFFHKAILAGVTDFGVVVVGRTGNGNDVDIVLTKELFELLGVDDTSFITVVMTDDSRVKSQLQRSPLAFDRARLTDLSALLNTHFTKQSREEMSAKLMGLSDQIAPELFLVLSATVGYAAEILEETAKKDVFTTGASQILKMPEYRDLDKAHDLMTFFVDNKENLPVPEDDTPLKILIGPENVNEALRDTSVVVASYDIGDGMRGLVGVVGPTRMDYATVTARLSYFADSLTRMFGKSELPPKEEKE